MKLNQYIYLFMFSETQKSPFPDKCIYIGSITLLKYFVNPYI